MELVTEPVIHDAETAGKFARELQLLLRTLGAGKANLEKGEMRIEANISISKTDAFGTKVEVKNINSFRSVERAIAYELKRQEELLESGGKVVQETRGWNEAKQETFHQRFKEGSADYRYFPEPDLPKVLRMEISDFKIEPLRAALPELPWQRRERYATTYQLPEDSISYISADNERGAFFDEVAAALQGKKDLLVLAANYLVSDLAGIYAKRGNEAYSKLSSQNFAKLIMMTAAGDLSSRGAKDVLAILVEEGGNPETIAKDHGLLQTRDTGVLEAAIEKVIASEPKAVDEYRGGKQAALQFLIGKGMQATKGAGNPGLLREIIQKRLG
jgi:aspartyl-tRNA(Asn)/glutamyl-tRNA(Gln) amidotransferase subunit B